LIQRIQRQQRPLVDSPYNAPELPVQSLAENAPPSSHVSDSKLQKQLNTFQQHGASALKSWRVSGTGIKSASAWLRHNHKLALGIAFALVMSTFMMLWIQPEAFGLKAAQPIAAVPLNSPQLASPSPANAAASAAPSASAASENPSTSGSAAQVPSTQAPAQAAMATTPAEPVIETPEGTLQGQAWLRKLDANSFLLQHGTASSYAKVLDIQRRHPPLKDAQIIAAYRPGEKLAHFVIVSGPYSNLAEGYEASKRPGIPRSWVRPTRGLQEQLKSPT
jgi:hypothetical protein